MKIKLTFATPEAGAAFLAMTGEKSLDRVNIGLVQMALKAEGLNECQAVGEPSMFHIKHPDGTWTTELVADPIERLLNGELLEPADMPIKMLSTDSVLDAEEHEWAQNRIANRYNPLIANPYCAEFIPMREVQVIVVDSGINAEHQEFDGLNITNLWKLPDLPDYSDNLGHGTSITSLIAGTSLGINSDIVIMNVRISAEGRKPTLTELGQAMDAIAAHHATCPEVPKIVNMSWATPKSEYLKAKMQQLVDAGLFLVAAAGNSPIDIDDATPAGTPEVFTVAASKQDDTEMWTVYGTNKKIDVYAPGEKIWTASFTSNSGYGFTAGSSYSAAFVSGVASMLMGMRSVPLPASEIANVIRMDATPNALIVNDKVSQDENRLLHRPDSNSLPVDDVQFLGSYYMHEVGMISTNIKVLMPVSILDQFNDQPTTYSLHYPDPATEALLGTSTIDNTGFVQILIDPAFEFSNGELVKQLYFTVKAECPGMMFETSKIYFFLTADEATAMDVKPYLDELAASSSFTFLEEVDFESLPSKHPKS